MRRIRRIEEDGSGVIGKLRYDGGYVMSNKKDYGGCADNVRAVM